MFNKSKDTKTMWNTVRSLNIHKPSSSMSELSVDVNDLNTHYASVFTVTDEILIGETIQEYESKYTEENKDTTDISDKFFFKYVEPNNIIKAMLSVKSKAIGVDEVSIMFLMLCLPALLPVLVHIFNSSLQHGIFPSQWKLDNVIPIPKVKNPKVCKDYRPVSILCVLGKVLEKLVHNQVTEYLTTKGYHAEHQSGFRKGYSTITALLKVTDDIREAIDKRLLSLLVLLDLSKAFDCVHHDLLCTKLKYLGFSNATISWFKSYLGPRWNRVFVSHDNFSDWVHIKTGVPQGSVLGPLLFLIYLNELPLVLKCCSYVMYADDILLYIHFPLGDFDKYLKILTRDVINIKYCEQHNLVLNVSKT